MVLGCLLLLTAASVVWIKPVPAWASVGEHEGEVDGPLIESASVTDVTEMGATIEAQINPQDKETSYEIKLVWQETDPPTKGEPVSGGDRGESGVLLAGSGAQIVRLVATGLRKGYDYWYKVVANSTAGKAKDGPVRFEFWTSGEYPDGSGPGAPYESEISWWSTKLEESQSAQTVREYEERQRNAVKQAEEKDAQATAERAA